MRNLLKPLIELSTNSEFQTRQAAYERVLKSKEWEFVRDTLLTLKSRMLNDMLSLEYTKLDPTEKDVRQRAYYQMDELITFLSNPTKWIRFKRRFMPTNRPGVKPNQKGGK